MFFAFYRAGKTQKRQNLPIEHIAPCNPMKEKLSWHNEKRKVNDLIPNPENPRRMTEKQTDELRKSLEKFNLAEIPAINTDNKIVAGHMRVATLQLLGRGSEEIDVRVPNRPLTEKEYKEYLLRSNQNRGDWDWDLLANNFDINELIGAGFDEELSFMFDDVMSLSEDGFNVEKAIAEVGIPTTKPGDIIKLGNHVLLCGDATKAEDVAKLMGGVKTSFISCDPPYNIGLDYSKGISTEGKYKGSFTASKDKKSSPAYRAFIDASIKNALSVATKDAHIFFWCDENFVGKMQEIFEGNGYHEPQDVPLDQEQFQYDPAGGLQQGLRTVRLRDHRESFAQERTQKPERDSEPEYRIGKSGGRGNPRNVERLARETGQRAGIRASDAEADHPLREADEAMHEGGRHRLGFIRRVGSTLIAAEQLNRRAYLMEIDPVFCTVIKRRYEEYIKR